MDAVLQAEVVRAIQNQTAAVTIIIQLREGGSGIDPAVLAQLVESNAALEAVLNAGGGGSPPAT